MLFQKIKEDDGWIQVDYTATWRYGYDFMLDAVQTIIDTDFRDDTQRVAAAEIAGGKNTELLEKVRQSGMNLRRCEATAKECGALTVAGISNIMECPVQIVFFNQTNLVRLFCPVREYFTQNGDHVFDNYMNSIEIKAYCLDTERSTIRRLSEKGENK